MRRANQVNPIKSATCKDEPSCQPKSLIRQVLWVKGAGLDDVRNWSKDRTQFVLDAATREATTVLLDQRYFQLDTAAFAKFNAALDASPAENPRLRELLSRKAPWER